MKLDTTHMCLDHSAQASKVHLGQAGDDGGVQGRTEAWGRWLCEALSQLGLLPAF